VKFVTRMSRRQFEFYFEKMQKTKLIRISIINLFAFRKFVLLNLLMLIFCF